MKRIYDIAIPRVLKGYREDEKLIPDMTKAIQKEADALVGLFEEE